MMMMIINGPTAILLTLAAFSESYTQSVGLLGLGISLSLGFYQTKDNTKQNKRTHKNSCLEWNSNPQSHRSSDLAAAVIGSVYVTERK
jgi:hypothetical protein